MQLRDRFFIAQPPTLEPTLAQAAQAAGAWALIDATRAHGEKALDALDTDRVALRVTPETPVDPRVGLAILSTWRIAPEHVDDLQDVITTWNQAGVPVGVEVRTKEEGRRAVDAGADLLVARGTEGPGRVSQRSNLVLLPALAEHDVPLIAWGGAGPNATGALFVHADAVVLDNQLALLDEAGLPDAWKRALDAFDGSDIKALGSTLQEPYHVHARVADEHVHELWQDEQASDDGPTTLRRKLQDAIQSDLIGYKEEPGDGFFPLGHDAAHARAFSRFDTLEDVLDWLETRIADQLDSFPFTEDAPLAQEHGTPYPIVQGAMANVSEVPEFARAVADAGALPFLAFAALRENWAREALEGTLDALEEAQPFGCGIIGLDVNAKKRDAHIRLLKEHQPPYALIAAGTAEQALDLEDAGIDTYLHTPSRGIVQQALEMGLRRIVVEGNECGGHIGKLPSLVLWDQTLQETETQGITDVNVLLAGGISDDASAAMAGTLAAGTPARVGALMGTAYLATKEIVDTGAIPDSYQDLVLASQDTEVTGDTVGIRARSAPTPFTDELNELEQELLRSDLPLEERKQTFENANLGATRLAARRLRRGDDGTYHKVPIDEQLHDGNFLMGQGAELITQRYTLDELHEHVTHDAADLAETARDRLQTSFTLPHPTQQDTGNEEAVAIVGLGCVFPDAPSIDAFWTNLMEGHVSIQNLPEDRWPIPPETHYRPEEQDGTYTLLGAFVQDDVFDPIEYRIPPTVADQMDPAQKWAIEATKQALDDAGLTDIEDRSRWAVILGNSQGEQRSWSDRRLAIREAIQTLQGADLSEDARQAALAPMQDLLEQFDPLTEDTMPGELSNVIAGRICNTFDIGGPARTIDTACASSLAATEEAIRQLRDGVVDVALTGGVDRSMDPSAYAKFSAIGALSSDGSYPFSEQASGFVMGEGCGILALKRLNDAQHDGDKIYAVIEGAGSSSDGAGKGITAPNEGGQARAIERAWHDANLDPSTLAFIEAHGTATPVGDPVEASTLEAMIGPAEPGSIPLGSVKANIGHLKSAAGAAGLIKATLALHHGQVPPTPVEDPTDEIDWDTSPFTLAQRPAQIPTSGARAGVSAFGFGGTNSHVVLASKPSQTPEPETPQRVPVRVQTGATREDVAQRLETGKGHPSLEDPLRVALTPDADMEAAKKVLAGELPADLGLSKGVVLAEGDTGELGLVFPGQGSQYPGMVLDLAKHYPAARDVLNEADQVLTPLLGKSLSSLLALEGKEGKKALTPTEVCQPAVLTCDIAVLRVLEEFGVEPDIVAGHSLGEYAALVAAGVLSFEDALHAVSARGREMADVEVDDPGGLIALRAGPDTARELIDGLDAWPANLNGPEQTVVAGTTQALGEIKDRADEQGIQASQLPVSAAFHSPIVAPATEPLREVFANTAVDPPEIPVIANTTGEPYPRDPDKIRDLLAEQVASPVRWTETMEAFQARGVDLIVEAGPKRVLANLARANVPETRSVPTSDPRQGANETIELAFAALAAHGHMPTAYPSKPTHPHPTASTGSRTNGHQPARTNGHRATPGHGHVQDAASKQPRRQERRVVVTGVSAGLPAPDQAEDPFGPEAMQDLLSGENRIGRVPEAQKDQMASMGVTRLVKDAPGGPTLTPIDDPEDVIHLAGRVPDVDLGLYDADEDYLAEADPTSRLAVAAALEALNDAKIPLVPDERETSTGTVIHDGWSLPEPMRDETGVIFASAFPGDASLIEAVQQASTQHQARSTDPHTLIDAVKRLSEHIETPQGEKELLDWVTETHTTTSTVVQAPQGEGFPRGFLFQALAMGHAQVAQLIDARGPNLHVNAACASTTSAIALAQDWIQQGRCERVLVVGADVAGNEPMLPWIGSGFLAAGAATTSKDVEQAALPFDERRHGMLVGSGAVGLVLETDEAAAERGLEPLAELVATHVANSAYHGARLDPDHVSEQVQRLIEDATTRLDMEASQLAEDLVFVSHEPATPARGGSAEAEVNALRAALGDAASEVLVTNTKGLTGHAMGAGIEDAIAVELLRARQAPPVANLEKIDPDFTDLTFSQGQPTDRAFSLRFAAGFGSQVALALFHRVSKTPGAVDEATFDAWIEQAVGTDATVQTQDRLLRVIREGSDHVSTKPQQVQATSTGQATQTHTTSQAQKGDTASTSQDSDASQTTESQDVSAEDVQALLTDLISAKTGYPADVIEPAMDLEADLGVDTVKQAEVLSEARSELGIPPIEGMSLSDVPTLEAAASLLAQHAGDEATGSTPSTDESEPEPAPQKAANTDPATRAEKPPQTGDSQRSGSQEEVQVLLMELVSAKTGYPADVIEPAMDLEADLGVDTVKQAEVLSEARSELGIPPIEGMSLSDVPTLKQAATLLAEHWDDGDGASQNGHASPTASSNDPPTNEEHANPIQTLSLTTHPAPAAEPLPENANVHLSGDTPDALGDVLTRQGATLSEVEEADLVIHTVEPSPDPEALTDLLETLQGLVHEDTRLILLAQSEARMHGLAPLASTLSEEGYPTRSIHATPETPAERIAQELLTDTKTNVYLTETDRREPVLATWDPSPSTPRDTDEPITVLAPGGLGAAVEPCLAALADEYEVRLALAGRSPIQDPELDPDNEDEVAQLRSDLLDEARQGQDPVKPAEIEAELQTRIKHARRAQALHRLNEAAAETRYDRVDATDPDAMQDWLETITSTWGQPDLVVHATGAEKSRPFEAKDRDEMSTVLGVKLAPARWLTENVANAHHVAFGSIAGVLGNPAQADYALANGTLTDLIEQVEGTIIHWTAWDAAGGMADDDTVRQVLEDKGIAFLDPENGAERFATWAFTPGTLVVTDHPAQTPLTHATPNRLDLTGDEAWLTDHAVNDRPLLPGVRHLESIQDAWQRTGHPTQAFHEVRFERPLWVTEPTHVEVHTDTQQGQTRIQDTRYARARRGPGDGVKPVLAHDIDAEPLTADAIYDALFHGPTFQPLEEARVTDDHVHANARLDTGGATPWAMALEAGMQAAGLAGPDTHALPVGIEAVEIERDPVLARARVDARLVTRDVLGSTWDVTVRDADGPVLHARGIRLQRSDAVPLWTDAALGLSDGDWQVRAVPVGPHEPRDPRSKRAAEREAGTEAANRALEAVYGPEREVGVDRDEDGRPIPVDAEGGVSITHGHGIAVAGAHPSHDRVGVDVERVQARPPSWLEEHFSDQEQVQIREHAMGVDAASTLVWTLKEAASKALGTGLDRPAEAFEVTLEEDSARIVCDEGVFVGVWRRVEEAVVSRVFPAQ